MLYDKQNSILAFINPVTIGRIGGVYGVLGWVKIIAFTEKSDSVFSYTPWFIYLKFVWTLIYVEKWTLLNKYYIAKIQDISDRESAKLLVHCCIVTDIKQFPCLKNDEYYCRDLIGCKVIDLCGEYLGCVINIIETTANDVLVIKINKKNSFYTKKECLIPFVQNKVIKTVNISDRIIIVDWDIDF